MLRLVVRYPERMRWKGFGRCVEDRMETAPRGRTLARLPMDDPRWAEAILDLL